MFVQLPLKPANVGLDAGTYGDRGSGTQAVLLRDQHGHHLMPAGSQGVEDLGLGVPQRSYGWSNRFGEVSQYRSSRASVLASFPVALAKSRT